MGFTALPMGLSDHTVKLIASRLRGRVLLSGLSLERLIINVYEQYAKMVDNGILRAFDPKLPNPILTGVRNANSAILEYISRIVFGREKDVYAVLSSIGEMVSGKSIDSWILTRELPDGETIDSRDMSTWEYLKRASGSASPVPSSVKPKNEMIKVLIPAAILTAAGFFL